VIDEHHHAGARGIAVIGQHGLRVENLPVDGTASSGIIIGNDDYIGQRPPTVAFRHGCIQNVGVFAPRVGNQDGMETYSATYEVVDDVTVHTLREARTRGYAKRRGQRPLLAERRVEPARRHGRAGAHRDRGPRN
jgi:hypothetical protein